jgi:hypothetical protein
MLRFAYVVYARLFARYKHSVKTSKYTSIPVIVCTYVVRQPYGQKQGQLLPSLVVGHHSSGGMTRTFYVLRVFA